MTPLLVLLALLSVATLASKRGAFGELVGGAATPVLVAVGLGLSPRGLNVLTSSIVEGLAPALSVGVCWLGLVAGLRAAAATSYEKLDRRIALPIVNGAIAALVLIVAQNSNIGSDEPWLPAALLIGACLGAPSSTGSEDRFARAVALLCAWGALAIAAPLSLALALGLGLVGGLVIWLVSGQDKVAAVVALLGVVTLVAGLSTLLHVPGVLVGVGVGAVLSRLAVGATLWPIAERSERPVRIVVTVVLAASASVDLEALVIGAILAAVASLATIAALGPKNAARTGSFGTSSIALALLASFATAGIGGGLVGAVLIAVAIVDAVQLVSTLALKAKKNGGA